MTQRRRPQRDYTDAPNTLEPEQKERIRVWCAANYPPFLRSLGHIWVKCRDHHLANGIQRVDWEATFRNWLRKEHEITRKLAASGDPTARDRLRPELEVLYGRRD